MLRPAERGERHLAFAQDRPRSRPRTFDAEAHVGHETKLDVHSIRRRYRLAVSLTRRAPLGRQSAVVEGRLAVEVYLRGSLHALDQTQQDMVGVVVGRRPSVAL